MAEPNSPSGEETADTGRHAAASEPTSAAETDGATALRSDVARETIERNRAEARTFADAPEPVQEDRAAAPAAGVAPVTDERAMTRPVEPAPAPEPQPEAATPPPAPAEPQPVIAPAAEEATPPQKKGNRLVGTLWVLLACGIYQVVFFGTNALVALVFGGGDAVLAQIQSIARTSLAWIPVLLFFLLFELVVLITNRAGRVAYVFASLLVGAAVYVLAALLVTIREGGSLGDANTLAQTFLNWEFILIGLVAREVMLWTGLAIGSRGIRVRRRNREARRRYDEERTHAAV